MPPTAAFSAPRDPSPHGAAWLGNFQGSTPQTLYTPPPVSHPPILLCWSLLPSSLLPSFLPSSPGYTPSFLSPLLPLTHIWVAIKCWAYLPSNCFFKVWNSLIFVNLVSSETCANLPEGWQWAHPSLSFYLHKPATKVTDTLHPTEDNGVKKVNIFLTSKHSQEIFKKVRKYT